MFDRQELLSMMSDASKSARGYRSRENFNAMTDEQLAATWDAYMEEIAANDIREKQNEANAQAKWEAHIESLLRDNGIMRVDAIRWDMAAMDADINAAINIHNRGIYSSSTRKPNKSLAYESL